MTLFIQAQKQKKLSIKNDIDHVFQSVYTTVLGWIIDSVLDHNIIISKYNPLARSYINKLPKESNCTRNGLINI